MKKLHSLTPLMLIVWTLLGLLATPFALPSLAQKSPPQPTAPTKTQTATPFVSHRVAADPVVYTVDQLRKAYNVQPLIDAGFDGEGQAIALVEKNSFVQRDIDSFVKKNHLPQPHIVTVLIAFGGAKAKPLPPDAEATVDIEVALTIAPKATVIVYESALVFDTFPRILQDNRAHVVSMSLELCEQILPDMQIQLFEHRLVSPLHAQRTTIFVASGDWGAFGCAGQVDPVTSKSIALSIARTASVSALASDPAVTAVGGTLLHLKGGKYSAEEVWNTYELIGSSGGGMSHFWALPAYQVAYLMSDLNPNLMRQMPDVSASADNYDLIANGMGGRSGGTSLSAPLWAAGLVLVNQYLTSKLNDPKALLLGPEMFYALKSAYAAGKVDRAPFHEVTKGDNRLYQAAAGYNLATGLGTPDFYNIALDAQAIYSDPAASIEPGDANGLIKQGIKYYDQGKLDLALAEYNQVLVLEPKSLAAYVGQGLVYAAQGKLDLALGAYNQAIAINPLYAPVRVDRGLVYVKRGNLDFALADFKYATVLDSTYVRAYKEQGAVYEVLHQYALALRAYRRYLELAGDKADPEVVQHVKVLEAQSTLAATQAAAP